MNPLNVRNMSHMIMVNDKLVDRSSIIVDNVDMKDYPDFVDAYAIEAACITGIKLSDDDLDVLNDEYPDVIQSAAHDSMF